MIYSTRPIVAHLQPSGTWESGTFPSRPWVPWASRPGPDRGRSGTVSRPRRRSRPATPCVRTAPAARSGSGGARRRAGPTVRSSAPPPEPAPRRPSGPAWGPAPAGSAPPGRPPHRGPQGPDRFGLEGVALGHSDPAVRPRVPRPQDVGPRATRGRRHEPPRRVPHAAPPRGEVEGGGVAEVHRPSAPAGRLAAWLPLVRHDGRRRAGGLRDRLLGRRRDRPRLAATPPPPVLADGAALAAAPGDAGRRREGRRRRRCDRGPRRGS